MNVLHGNPFHVGNKLAQNPEYFYLSQHGQLDMCTNITKCIHGWPCFLYRSDIEVEFVECFHIQHCNKARSATVYTHCCQTWPSNRCICILCDISINQNHIVHFSVWIMKLEGMKRFSVSIDNWSMDSTLNEATQIWLSQERRELFCPLFWTTTPELILMICYWMPMLMLPFTEMAHDAAWKNNR